MASALTEDNNMVVPEWGGYFERQELARCGMHALNNALGARVHTAADMHRACDVFLQESEREGNPQEREDHEAPNGWFSYHVMTKALTNTAMTHMSRVMYVMDEQPLHAQPNRIHHSKGAIVNIDDSHWVALRAVAGQVWLLDSLKPAPTLLTQDQYVNFVRVHPYAFAITDAPLNCAADASMPGALSVPPRLDVS